MKELIQNSNAEMKFFKFDEYSDNLYVEISNEIDNAKMNGKDIFIIADSSGVTNGFKKGFVLSNIIMNLRKVNSEGINIAIKNTFGDITFYKVILEKVPNIHFVFDKECAGKYSKNTIEEWNDFIKSCHTMS